MHLGVESEIPGIDHRLWMGELSEKRKDVTNLPWLSDGKMSMQSRQSLVVSSRKGWADLQLEQFRKIPTLGKDGFGFEKIKILLFVRNPINRVVNMWRQRVKFGAYSHALEHHMQYENDVHDFLARTETLINWFSGEKDVELITFNFSHIGTNHSYHTDIIGNWLGIEKKNFFFEYPETYLLLLDLGEVRLQYELNRILGSSATLLAKALAARDKYMKLSAPKPPVELQQKIWDTVKPIVERINQKIPEAQHVIFDKVEPSEQEAYRFNDEQLKIIAACLGGEIRGVWEKQNPVMKAFRNLMTRFQ